MKNNAVNTFFFIAFHLTFRTLPKAEDYTL